MTECEWTPLFKELWKINIRDYLIVKVIYYTQLSSNYVLMLRRENFIKKRSWIIHPVEEALIYEIPLELTYELADYLQDSDNKDLLFKTNNNKPVFRTRIVQVMTKASQDAGFDFVVTIQMLRDSSPSLRTLKLQYLNSHYKPLEWLLRHSSY